VKIHIMTSSKDIDNMLWNIYYAGKVCYDASHTENKYVRDLFIRRLIKSGHESVIEHGSATFRINGISRACSHQLVRHRLASYSQRSQRYVKEDTPSYVTPPEIEKSDYLSMVYENQMKDAWQRYRQLIGAGVSKEDARFVLPNACTTEIMMTMNFREIRHFLKLRLAKNAQWEIRKLAECVRTAMISIGAGVIVEGIDNEPSN